MKKAVPETYPMFRTIQLLKLARDEKGKKIKTGIQITDMTLLSEVVIKKHMRLLKSSIELKGLQRQ